VRPTIYSIKILNFFLLPLFAGGFNERIF